MKKQGALTSVWEMTVSERKNAATILENTTARPFVYCRYFFKCFFCREQYNDVRNLLDHTSSHETPNKMTILKELLTKGQKNVRVDISGLKCKLCKEHFDDLEAIAKHLAAAHEMEFTPSGNGIIVYNLESVNGQFRCHICKKIFQTFILLNRHLNVHFSNAICEQCGVGFMTHQRLLQHKEIHSPGGYPCKKCKKVYTTNSNLKFHVEKVHNGSTKMKMLKCPHCAERFNEHFRKLRHLKEVHDISFTFECDTCQAVFNSRRAMTMHANKYHTRKTQCDVCKKSFACRTTLRRHMVSHTGERNHVCHICHKTYRHQKSLKQHLKAHDVNLSCSDCGSAFVNKNEYNKHRRDWHQRALVGFSNKLSY